MTGKIFIVIAGAIIVLFQSFRCVREPLNQCSVFKQDSVLLNVSVTNSNLVYHIGDTILVNSTISDNLIPVSGTGSFTVSLDQLYLNVQPFSVVITSGVPQLQYANNEFDPVVTQGTLQNSAYSGYNFLYVRANSLNSLKIGFVAGRTGLYIMETMNQQYSLNYPAIFNKPGDQCTSYPGISSFPETEQNKNYWNTLGLNAISLPPNYGSVSITKDMKNYFIFEIVP